MTGNLFKSLFSDLIIAEHDGNTFIPTFADALYQRDLAQERQVILFSKPFTALLSEYVILMVWQFCRGKIAHILYQPNHRDIQLRLAEHGNAFLGICKGNILWGGYYHGTCYRHRLH